MSQSDPMSESLQLKLIPAFVEAIQSVVNMMVGIRVTVLTPHLKREPGLCHDVSGIIGFSGALAGTTVLSFPYATATKLVSMFAGAELAPTSPDFADAVGELTNMIAGSAKSQLGEVAGITTPVVVVGANHSVPLLRGVPCLVIPCQCEAGEFAIELNVKRQVTAQAA